MHTEKSILIGICGLKGSGKSEVSRLIYDELNAARIKFAKPLKDMLRAIGLSEDEIEGPLKEQPCEKLCGQTPRHAMLTLGTEWGREMIGDDIWVRAWLSAVNVAMANGVNVISDDLRFPNEYEALTKAGGIVLRVARPGIPVGEHQSEQHALNFAAHIECYNDGDLDDLEHWAWYVFPAELERALGLASGWGAK